MPGSSKRRPTRRRIASRSSRSAGTAAAPAAARLRRRRPADRTTARTTRPRRARGATVVPAVGRGLHGDTARANAGRCVVAASERLDSWTAMLDGTTRWPGSAALWTEALDPVVAAVRADPVGFARPTGRGSRSASRARGIVRARPGARSEGRRRRAARHRVARVAGDGGRCARSTEAGLIRAADADGGRRGRGVLRAGAQRACISRRASVSDRLTARSAARGRARAWGSSTSRACPRSTG